MKLINRKKDCVMEVRHEDSDVTGLGVEIANVSNIVTQRRIYGTTDWTDILTKIIVAGIATYSVYDYTALSKIKYEYRAKIVASDGTYYTEASSVTAEFMGLLIAEESGGYVALIEPEAKGSRNYNMVYVKPYYSRYPHAVSNGSQNFSSGEFSGTFNRLDDLCRVQEENGVYAEEIASFLTDTVAKVVKTPWGYGWYAMMDEKMNTEIDSSGLLKISGNWNEIGAYPAKGKESFTVNGVALVSEA